MKRLLLASADPLTLALLGVALLVLALLAALCRADLRDSSKSESRPQFRRRDREIKGGAVLALGGLR